MSNSESLQWRRSCADLLLRAAAGDAEALGTALALAEAAGCPQAELEAAKAELAALRRVVVRGAPGPLERYVSGAYSVTNETVNGKPVFVMEGQPTRCLFMAKDRRWYAALVTRKDANEPGGWAHTDPGFSHPAHAKEWIY